MTYLYSQINRLEQPHTYMYAPFQGEDLLQSYQASRMAVLRRCQTAEPSTEVPDHLLLTYALPALVNLFTATSYEAGNRFRTLSKGGSTKPVEQSAPMSRSVVEWAKGLEKLTTAEPVATLDLLHAVIAVQLIDVKGANTKVWLDRLVQRFEVTKKIYEYYPPGFRKGDGANTSVRLYWLFALALCLFYVRSNEIKYLNALLKVSDLLCSLPELVLQGHIPKRGLSVVLATEIVGVVLLAEKKGVSFAPK